MKSTITSFPLAPRVSGGNSPSLSRIKPPVVPNFGPMRSLAPQSSQTTAETLPMMAPVRALPPQGRVADGAGGSWAPQEIKPPVALPRVAPKIEATGLIGQLKATVLGSLLHHGTQMVTRPRDFAQNARAGVAKGSLLTPDALGGEPENPDQVVQMISALPAAVAEGVGVELGVLRGLAWAAGRGGRVGGLAERALRLFGSGEGLSIPRQVGGAAALSVGAEAGLQGTAAAVGDQSLEDAASNMRPMAMIGGAVAGTAAAPGIVNRATKPLQRIPWVEARMQELSKTLGNTFRYENEMRPFSGSLTAEAGGDLRQWNLSDDFRVYDAMSRNIAHRVKDDVADFFAPMVHDKPAQAHENLVELVRTWRDQRVAFWTGKHEDARLLDDHVQLLRDSAPTAVREVFEQHTQLAAKHLAEADDLGELTTTMRYFDHKAFAPETFDEYVEGLAELMYKNRVADADASLIGTVVREHGRPLEAMPSATASALRGGQEVNGLRLVLPEDPGAVRSIRLALGDGADAIAVPAPIARRLEKLHSASTAPQWLQKYANPGTFYWKSSILMWSWADIITRNAIGDAAAFGRSFPAATVDGASYRRAFEHQRDFYKLDSKDAKLVGKTAGMSAGLAAVGGGFGLDGEWETEDAINAAILGGMLSGASRLGQQMRRSRSAAAPLALYDDVQLAARDEQRRLADLGVIDSGYVGAELAKKAPVENVQTALRGYMDEVATILTGQPTGETYIAGKIVDRFATVARERENYLRMVAFYNEVKRGTPEQIAAKRAREALIDYGKFSEFESRWMRGFLLPFYSFARHNVPNWIKAAAGADVGGGGGKAAAMTWGMMSFDAAGQAWNEAFFPDVERTLDPNVRQNFHLIAGNPLSGEVLRDENGRPIVLGVEMPYEQMLEITGLGRPGAIYSAFFGNGIHEDDSLVARSQRIEDFNLLSEAAKAPFRGAVAEVKALLTPALSLPIEFLTGNNLAWGTPVIQDWKDESERVQWLEHAAKKVVAAYSSIQRSGRETEGAINSHFGLGLPIHVTDQDRALRFRLMDMMDLAQDDVTASKPWAQRIRELVQRGEEVVTADEYAAANEIAKEAEDPQTAAHIMRYYTKYRGDVSNLQKAWDGLDVRARATFLRRLEPADMAAFVVYLNGGEIFNQNR